MQVTELSAEGLKREFKVVVQADEIEDRVTRRLDELRQKIRMPGFRPGKVPVALLAPRAAADPSAAGNPIALSADDYAQLYRRVLTG